VRDRRPGDWVTDLAGRHRLEDDMARALAAHTSALPRRRSAAAHYLADLGPDIFDVVATTGDLAGYLRLRQYLQSDPPLQLPLAAPWRARAHQLSLLDDYA
jgi:hypothetical protein